MNKQKGTPDYIDKFVRFLKEVNWHEALIPPITTFLESKYTESDVDNLMMSSSKTVETVLRNTMQQLQGSTVGLNLSGERLLESAVNCHLIKNKDAPLYTLIFWIFKEPRNTAHHEFELYPYKFLVLSTLQADYAVREIDELTKSRYESSFKLELDEPKKEIRLNDVRIFRPDKTNLPSTEKAEGFLTFTNGKTASVALTPNTNGTRSGRYDYRGDAAGTIRVNLRGINGQKPFIAQSGSTAFISMQSKMCPKCGRSIDERASKCPHCGNRLYVY